MKGRKNMPLGMDKDSLEAFRRQLEEDYRLDMGAIERLQRRFLATQNTVPNNPVSSNPTPNNAVLSNPISGSVIPAQNVPSSFDSSPTSGPNSFDSSPSAGSSNEWRTEPRSMVLPTSGPAVPHKDELVDSLRSMFSTVRR